MYGRVPLTRLARVARLACQWGKPDHNGLKNRTSADEVLDMQTVEPNSELSWVNRLPVAVKREVEANCIQKEFHKGETVCARGEKPSGVYFLRTGRIKISTASERGKEITIGFQAPPHSFCEAQIVTDSNILYSYTSIEESTLSFLNRCAFNLIRERHPAVNEMLLQYTSQYFINFARMFDRTLLLPLEQRVASRLFALSAVIGDRPEGEGDGLVVPLSQSDLASVMNASRQSINRILKRFEKDGLVSLPFHSIVVRSPQNLLERARAGGSNSNE